MRKFVVSLVLVMGLSLLSTGAWAGPKVGMQWLGYRISVTPVVVEVQPGQLKTRSLLWRLRSVYRSIRGELVYAMPRVAPKLRAKVRGTEVMVQRPWSIADVTRRGPVYGNLKAAVRAFTKLKLSNDLRRLQDTRLAPPAPVVRRPVVVRPTTPRPVVRRPVKMAPPPSCKQVLLAKKHHPVHLKKCRGAEPSCAVALLKAGHHPNYLNKCKPGLDPVCVRQVLARKHSPTHLSRCAGVNRLCAVTLLAQGHSPVHLSRCKKVDGRCAKALLEAGNSPIHLGRCR